MTTSTKRKRINFLWIVSIEALAFLLVVAASSSAQVAARRLLKLPPFTANKGELLQKLRERKFQDLDTLLNSYQAGFEQNPLAEGNLANAFEAFASLDPALGPILDSGTFLMPAAKACSRMSSSEAPLDASIIAA